MNNYSFMLPWLAKETNEKKIVTKISYLLRHLILFYLTFESSYCFSTVPALEYMRQEHKVSALDILSRSLQWFKKKMPSSGL